MSSELMTLLVCSVSVFVLFGLIYCLYVKVSPIATYTGNDCTSVLFNVLGRVQFCVVVPYRLSWFVCGIELDQFLRIFQLTFSQYRHKVLI